MRHSVVVLALMLVSCSGAQAPTPVQSAHIALNTAAHALVTLDGVTDVALMATQRPMTVAAAEKWVTFGQRERAAQASLLAAEAAVYAYSDGTNRCGAQQALRDAENAINETLSAATDLGVTPPPAVLAVVAPIEQIAVQLVPPTTGCTATDGGLG